MRNISLLDLGITSSVTKGRVSTPGSLKRDLRSFTGPTSAPGLKPGRGLVPLKATGMLPDFQNTIKMSPCQHSFLATFLRQLTDPWGAAKASESLLYMPLLCTRGLPSRNRNAWRESPTLCVSYNAEALVCPEASRLLRVHFRKAH